jgi:hypothetical protein
LLCACAVQPQRPPADLAAGPGSQLDALRTALPGFYSNFADRHELGEDGPVTDVTVRHLGAGEGAAFLFSRKYREGQVGQHQLYLFTPGDSPDVLVARFAPLGEAQLSAPLPQIIAAAQQRFRPGCALVLAATPAGLTGQTDAGTCRFEHPQAGDVGLLREFSFGRGTLLIAERLLDAAGRKVGEDGVLRLQKHRQFDGWAGIRVDPELAPDDPAAWRLAARFGMADDGRVEPLLDAAGDPFDFGLQLARIRWRADRPPILRLAVVELATGEIRAYAWSDPGSAAIGINLDWFQAGLEAVQD